MKKLYEVNISADTDIIVAAESQSKAVSDTKHHYVGDVFRDMCSLDVFVTANEVIDKKRIKDEFNSRPYGDDRTIKEIWKEIEKYNREKAHKEWLEKYHMTFDFYKETANGR